MLLLSLEREVLKVWRIKFRYKNKKMIYWLDIYISSLNPVTNFRCVDSFLEQSGGQPLSIEPRDPT